MVLTLNQALKQCGQAGRGSLRALDTLLRSIVQAEAGAELQFLNGVVAGTGAASKACVLDASGDITMPSGGEIEYDGNVMAVTAGAGITAGSGTVVLTSVFKVGDVIKTKRLIDLTGLSSATSDLDIIGIGTTAPAHIGQITAARNGTIIGGRIKCLELPASLTDIDFYSATVGTGATTYFEAGIAALVETALLTKGGAWALNDISELTALPAADAFLYLVNGAGDTADVFTAGRFLIEFEGYDA